MWIPHTIVYKDAEMATWLFSDARTGQVCKTTNFSDRHVLQQLGNMDDEDKPVVVVKKVRSILHPTPHALPPLVLALH